MINGCIYYVHWILGEVYVVNVLGGKGITNTFSLFQLMFD